MAHCAVVGCGNKYAKLRKWADAVCDVHEPMKHTDCPCFYPYKLHYFPKNEETRREWLKNINRKDFSPGKHAAVCSLHFIDGKPTDINPNPMLTMGYNLQVKPGRRKIKRNQKTPAKKTTSHHPQETLSGEDHNVQPEVEASSITSEEASGPEHLLKKNAVFQSETTEPGSCSNGVGFEIPTYANITTQVNFGSISYACLSSEKVKFYTGLEKPVLDKLLLFFSDMHVVLPTYKLSLADQVLAVLIRLRLGLLVEDLAERFCISPSLVCKIFKYWICLLSEKVGKIVCWLPPETIKATMPLKFKEQQPNTTCIIDCTEIFLQRAKRHRAKSQTYSNYKTHNTVKFLVAIAPNGYFMYVSPVYGGKASDKHIVLNSGFMGMLSPGDTVMADRGFKIAPELAKIGVTLNIPSSTLGKTQLSEEEVTETRRIASCRIHVERAIRRLKTYHILNTVLPIRSIKHINQTILTIAALCNLKPPLVA